MRVLHAYRTYFPDTQGGLEEVIRQICLNTKPLGVESKVLSLSVAPNQEVLTREEAEVHRYKQTFEVASCGFSVAAIRGFKRLVEWADVVHYHFPWPFADALHLAARVTKPSLLTYHSDIVRQRWLRLLYAPLMNRFLRHVNSIVCTSPNYYATSDVLRRFEEKVEIVPIGLSESSYTRAPPSVRVAVERDFGRDFFLFIGVLRYYKGLHILLNAIHKAPYRVVIAGSGPTEEQLRRQAHELGLDNVIFAGNVTDADKMALLELSLGVVFPSYMRSEAFGVTLLEGAIFQKPLISTEIGSGTSHVNVDGVTGLVVPPGCPRALRSAMDQIWRSPEAARSMGNQARKRYEEFFTGELMGLRYNVLYRRLTGQLPATCESIATELG